MRTVYERQIAEATEIEGRILRGRDVFVRTTKFHAVCKVLWPDKKLAPFLAEIGDRDERSAKRWLSGEFEPPICVALAVFNEIFKSK